MKKIIALTLVLVMGISLFGCGPAKWCSGEWKFSEIVKVELSPDLDEGAVDDLKELYGAEDEEAIQSKVLDNLVAEGTFAPFYVKFDQKYTYTYDPLMEREATWVFYQTGENEGFISFDAELDASKGNPSPLVFPAITYSPATNTMVVVVNYSSFMVTVALTK